MSRARHKAKGGGVKAAVYAGEGSNVLKEAEERKRGGKVMHGEGENAKTRKDRPKRARGGMLEHEERKRGGNVEHEVMPPHRAKGGRVRGEGVGANLTPLSTAAKVKEVTKGEEPEEGVRSD